MKKAVVLFSGGLDSTTCLALAKSEGVDCYALSFNYGQRHYAELNAAKRIIEKWNIPHHIIELPLGQWGGSVLTNKNQDILPSSQASTGIPATYVPARNTIFLSFALAWAEIIKTNDIYIGVSAVDYSGYPDCRPEYIAAFQRMANLATKTGIEEGKIKIHAPLIHLSKAETIKLGLSLGIDYKMTVSCYQANANGHACGQCDSCVLRKKGFREAQSVDDTLYYS
ncbi:MAG: queC [Gammaproteobacteria bacterium]|jgi:7-cyano-7-deazaguanine synthase|nr:queC [Gammaproteobacteria bacterium]